MTDFFSDPRHEKERQSVIKAIRELPAHELLATASATLNAAARRLEETTGVGPGTHRDDDCKYCEAYNTISMQLGALPPETAFALLAQLVVELSRRALAEKASNGGHRVNAVALRAVMPRPLQLDLRPGVTQKEIIDPGCPICERSDGYLNWTEFQYAICSRHRMYWWIGESLTWMHLMESGNEQDRRMSEISAHYRDVTLEDPQKVLADYLQFLTGPSPIVG